MSQKKASLVASAAWLEYRNVPPHTLLICRFVYYSFPVQKVQQPFAAKTCQTAARSSLPPPPPPPPPLARTCSCCRPAHTTAPLTPPTAARYQSCCLGSRQLPAPQVSLASYSTSLRANNRNHKVAPSRSTGTISTKMQHLCTIVSASSCVGF
jgi:hypothetical protein